MRKKIFRSLQLDQSHSNTHWRKTVSFPGVRKKIFPICELDQSQENTHWRKTILLPRVWETEL